MSEGDITRLFGIINTGVNKGALVTTKLGAARGVEQKAR